MDVRSISEGDTIRQEREPQSAGCPMATSVKIEGYRCFKSVEVSDCRRINVVVGDNGSGKTAFLESIFLAAGAGAELALRTHAWRGYESIQGQVNLPDLEEALWGDLFNNYKYNSEVEIRLSGNRQHNRSVKFKFNPTGPVTIQVTKDRNAATVDALRPSSGITFDWHGPNGLRYKSVAKYEEGRLKIVGDVISPIEFAFFASMALYSSQETAARFSTLSKSGREQIVGDAFKRLFPDVEGLSLELSGNAPMVFANLFGQTRKVPLNLISGGMTKLSAILFAMPSAKDGIIVVDEIENGFYYKRLPNLWSVLNKLSADFNVQMFIATHSLECLRAAAEEAKNNPEDFSMIRAERHGDEFSLKQYSGDQFVGAVNADLEIR